MTGDQIGGVIFLVVVGVVLLWWLLKGGMSE